MRVSGFISGPVHQSDCKKSIPLVISASQTSSAAQLSDHQARNNAPLAPLPRSPLHCSHRNYCPPFSTNHTHQPLSQTPTHCPQNQRPGLPPKQHRSLRHHLPRRHHHNPHLRPQLALYIGPTTIPADRSKSCIALLTLRHPSTERFSLSSTTYHGTAALDAGLTASLRTQYSDGLTGSVASSSAALTGPVVGTYTRQSSAQGAGDRPWASWPGREETVVRVDTRAALTATRVGVEGAGWGGAPFTLETQVVGVVWLGVE